MSSLILPVLTCLLYAALAIDTAAELPPAYETFRPDLVSLCALLAALALQRWPALVFAAVCGLLRDSVGGGAIGPGIITMSGAAFVVLRAQRTTPIHSIWKLAPVSFGFVLLTTSPVLVERVFSIELVTAQVWSAFSSSLTAVAVLPAVQKWNRFWRQTGPPTRRTRIGSAITVYSGNRPC